MIYLLNPDSTTFPNPDKAEADGLLAIGGDLSPKRLITAYRRGIFPWFNDDDPILWWSLDPRMVMPVGDFRCSKSLLRTLKSQRYEVRVDTCFEEVIARCADTERPDQPGTWIVPDMITAYTRLHDMGYAHSFETFLNGQLVGGLYGVSVGRFFSGESMFHTHTDASKVAFAKLVEYCALHGFDFIDAQQPTQHLFSLGASPIPRKQFLGMLGKAVDPALDGSTFLPRWKAHSTVLLLGGNQGDRTALMLQAQEAIQQRIGTVALRSGYYETEPWGDFGDEEPQRFLNMAVVVDTDLTADKVLAQALDIERQLGRRRPAGSTQYHSRLIDIDIIFYDSFVVDTPRLQLPHPRAHLRHFVMQPLADIIPAYVHPTLRRTVAQLLADCPDSGAVTKYPSPQ